MWVPPGRARARPGRPRFQGPSRDRPRPPRNMCGARCRSGFRGCGGGPPAFTAAGGTRHIPPAGPVELIAIEERGRIESGSPQSGAGRVRRASTAKYPPSPVTDDAAREHWKVTDEHDVYEYERGKITDPRPAKVADTRAHHLQLARTNGRSPPRFLSYRVDRDRIRYETYWVVRTVPATDRRGAIAPFWLVGGGITPRARRELDDVPTVGSVRALQGHSLSLSLADRAACRSHWARTR